MNAPIPTLRILHLIHTLSMGGGEYHLVQNARGMRARNCDVRILCRGDNVRLCAALNAAGIPISPVQPMRWMPLGWALGFAVALLREVRAWAPDIICANTLTTAFVAAFLKAWLPGKLVYAVMVIRHNRRLLPLLRFIYRRLDAVLYNSRYTRDCYHAMLPRALPELINFSTVDDPRGHLRPIGEREALRQELLKGGSRLVGFVGRIHPEKGVMDFLHMAQMLLAEDTSLRFVVLGAKDEKFPEYGANVEHFASKNLGSAITFLGHLPAAAAYIAVMDCLVNPTYGEGFGRVALEAVYLGVPIVATEPGGMTEILEGYDKAYMVPWRRPDRMADAARSLLAAHPYVAERAPGVTAIARFAPSVLVENEVSFFEGLVTGTGHK